LVLVKEGENIDRNEVKSLCIFLREPDIEQIINSQSWLAIEHIIEPTHLHVMIVVGIQQIIVDVI
jgi:hypothetical protein